MRLTGRFFLSYLLVAAVTLGVLAVSMALFTPASFTDYMAGHMGGSMMRGGMMRGAPLETFEADLDRQFHNAVTDALVRAALAALVAAGVVSWAISRGILAPIRRLSAASNTIAEGHYDQRLSYARSDELGDLIDSFNRMAAALAETEAIRQQLIGDVSHELKTPLSSIKGFMEGLQDGVIPATPETFQLIHDEATRLERLARDLQELSRAEASFELLRERHPVSTLVADAVARLRPQFADKGVQLDVMDVHALPPVLVDRDRVVQVLINLLGNALQYTPRGGRVSVRVAQADSMLRVAVQDTGAGLAAEDLTRVFQRFYRVDKSRARTSGGSGIGLTIARHIVEAHGGRIWAESPGLGQGSTFIFTLPLA